MGYFESSDAESGGHEREGWRDGATSAAQDAGLGAERFEGICAQGGGVVSGAQGDVEGGGGAGGAGGFGCKGLVLAGEGDDEGDGGESSGSNSSSDGIGESGSVSDITDCLDFIGEVSRALW